MEAMQIWTDKGKVERIKELPKVFVQPGKDEKQGILVIYNTSLAKEQIINILNDED